MGLDRLCTGEHHGHDVSVTSVSTPHSGEVCSAQPAWQWVVMLARGLINE